MKNGIIPDPNVIHPIKGYDKEICVKPTVKNPNIIVGDFTYIADSCFESHVTHHYGWNGDKPVEKINELIPLLTCGNPDKVKAELRKEPA